MRPTDEKKPTAASATTPAASGRSILLSVVDTLFRHWPWILPLWILITLGAVAYYLKSPRNYESEMTFLVRNNRPEVVLNPDGSSFMQQRQADVSDAQMSTELQMLTSRELFEKLLPATGIEIGTEAQREAALARLQQQLQVAPVVKSNMIRARYANSDPKRVIDVLNRLGDAYLEEHLQLHANSGSLEFFDQQSKEAGKRWKDAQQKLLEFRQGSGVVSAVEEKDLLLRRQIELQTSLHQSEAELKDTSRRIDSIRPRLQAMSARVDTVARRIPNQYSAERLTTMLAELQNRRTELLSKYRPTERIVIQLDQQIADTTKLLQETSSRVSTEEVSDINPLRQTLENELGRAEGAEAGLRGRIQAMTAQNQAYHAELAKLDRLLPHEQQLQRETKVAEENFLLYSKRREEARIGQRMDEQKISNVMLSGKPRMPSAPKARLGTVLTVYAIAMVVGVLLVGLFSRFRKTVQTAWDLEGLSDIRVLGTVPVQKLPELPARMRGLS